MERVLSPVGGDFPAFGKARNAFASDRIEPSQPFEHGKGHAYVRLAGENGRIERFRFGAIDDDKVGPPF